jgi:hypothetical protein
MSSSFSDFAAARAEADATGGTVCGAFKPTGEPVYFVTPKDPSDQLVEEAAFLIRNGHRPTETERTLGAHLERLRRRTGA